MHEDGGQERGAAEEENKGKRKMKPTALTDERSPVDLFADSQQYAIRCSTRRRKSAICEKKLQRKENMVKIIVLVDSGSQSCRNLILKVPNACVGCLVFVDLLLHHLAYLVRLCLLCPMSPFLQYSILSRTRGAAIIECQQGAASGELGPAQPEALYDTYSLVFSPPIPA